MNDPTLPPRRNRKADPWSAPIEQPAVRDEEPKGVEAVQAQIERLRPLVRRMRRNWAWGLVGILFATLVVGAYAFVVFVPPYESETVVFYQSDNNSERSIQGNSARIDPTFIRELIFRRGRLEALIHEMNLHQDTIDDYGMGIAIRELEKNISFEPVGKSTFRISYVGDSAQEAHDVTAWLADHLVEEELDRRRRQALQSKTFLDEELVRTTEDLAKREMELGAFIAKHPRFMTTNNDAARETKLRGATGASDSTSNETTPTRRRYVMRHVRRSAGGGTTSAPAPPPAEPDPALVAKRQAAIEELTRATRQLSELQSQYTDAHPDVATAQSRLARAEAAVKEATQAVNASAAESIYANARPEPEPAEEPKPERVAIRVPVSASSEDEKEESDKGGAGPTVAELENLPPDELGAVETEWMRLKRAVEEARNRQERLAAESFRAEVQSRSQSSGHSARVVILDEAYVPDEPLRSRLFFGKIWAPMASLLAVLIVLGRALVDDRIYEPEDLAHLETTPLLTVIPPSAAS